MSVNQQSEIDSFIGERWLRRAYLALQYRIHAWRARANHSAHFRAVIITIIDESWRSWKHDPDDLLNDECGVIEIGRTGGYRQTPYDSMRFDLTGCLNAQFPGAPCANTDWSTVRGHYHKVMSIDDRAECMWVRGMRLATEMTCVVGSPWTGQTYMWPEAIGVSNVWHASDLPLLNTNNFWRAMSFMKSNNYDHFAGNWGLVADSHDTLGLYDSVYSTFYLKSVLHEPGPIQGMENYDADHTFIYRPVGWSQGKRWYPVIGDWDGDGIDGVGLYDPETGTFHLRNSLTTGEADTVFSFYTVAEADKYLPVAGNWDGSPDLIDTVGIYNRELGTFHLRNSNTAGPEDQTFSLGPTQAYTWLPVYGDWVGAGTDSVAIFNQRTSWWTFRKPDGSTFQIGFGHHPDKYWLPMVGDWDLPNDGDGIDTVGAYDVQAGAAYIRSDNVTGYGTDYVFINPGQVEQPGCDISGEGPPQLWGAVTASYFNDPAIYHNYNVVDLATRGYNNYITHLAVWDFWMDSIGRHRDGGCGHQGIRMGIIQPVNPGNEEYPEQTLEDSPAEPRTTTPPWYVDPVTMPNDRRSWYGKYVIDSANHPFTGDKHDLLPRGITELPGDSDRSVVDHVILPWPGKTDSGTLNQPRVLASDIINLFNQMTNHGAWNPDLIMILVDGSPSMRPLSSQYINTNINIHNNLTHTQSVHSNLGHVLDDEIQKAAHYFRRLVPPTKKTPFGYSHPLVECRLISEDWLGEAASNTMLYWLDSYNQNISHFHIGDQAYWNTERTSNCPKYDCPGCESP